MELGGQDSIMCGVNMAPGSTGVVQDMSKKTFQSIRDTSDSFHSVKCCFHLQENDIPSSELTKFYYSQVCPLTEFCRKHFQNCSS